MRVDAAEFVPNSTWLRVDAVEFVPAAASPAKASNSHSPEATAKGELSASSPEFVPGGTSVRWQAHENSVEVAYFDPTIDGGEDYSAEHDQSYSHEYGSDFDTTQGYSPHGVQAASNFDSMTRDEFLTPHLLEQDPFDSNGEVHGEVLIEGLHLQWHLPGGDNAELFPRSSCMRSPPFFAAGAPLQLTFYPQGEKLTAEGDVAVGLISKEKTKLKFELFFNSRTSGMKVMLGSKFSCDFRQTESAEHSSSPVVVSILLHENLSLGQW
mmetsp:Transcript_54362/g.100398  ORF Transcript_54362/g.100398 Transcript_54362/m.100398 type:complete len:267 (+) Transcript_54362:58-858(+)